MPQELKRKLMDRFTMIDKGDVSLVLGTQMTRDREAGALTIGLEHCTKSILARVGMAGCNQVHTTESGAEFSIDQPDDLLLDPTGTELYQSIAGSLVLLGQCKRYDITCTVNQLARAMSKPSKLYMTASKHLLRYLKGNMSLAIMYQTGCFQLTGFCDASWENNPDNGKSTSGYLFMMAGEPLSFKTALQSVTAQSTMEAGLISMALASQEAVYLLNMMAELGFGKLFNSVQLFVDNTGALHIKGNSTYSHARNTSPYDASF